MPSNFVNRGSCHLLLQLCWALQKVLQPPLISDCLSTEGPGWKWDPCCLSQQLWLGKEKPPHRVSVFGPCPRHYQGSLVVSLVTALNLRGVLFNAFHNKWCIAAQLVSLQKSRNFDYTCSHSDKPGFLRLLSSSDKPWDFWSMICKLPNITFWILLHRYAQILCFLFSLKLKLSTKITLHYFVMLLSFWIII